MTVPTSCVFKLLRTVVEGTESGRRENEILKSNETRLKDVKTVVHFT